MPNQTKLIKLAVTELVDLFGKWEHHLKEEKAERQRQQMQQQQQQEIRGVGGYNIVMKGYQEVAEVAAEADEDEAAGGGGDGAAAANEAGGGVGAGVGLGAGRGGRGAARPKLATATTSASSMASSMKASANKFKHHFSHLRKQKELERRKQLKKLLGKGPLPTGTKLDELLAQVKEATNEEFSSDDDDLMQSQDEEEEPAMGQAAAAGQQYFNMSHSLGLNVEGGGSEKKVRDSSMGKAAQEDKQLMHRFVQKQYGMVQQQQMGGNPFIGQP